MMIKSNQPLRYCPGTLAPLKEGTTAYSSPALKKLFNGQKVSPYLTLGEVSALEMDPSLPRLQATNRISISGVQFKLSLILDHKTLRPIREGEHGQYILKPVFSGNRFNNINHYEQMPANEHLTMQLAEQIFGITTAQNGLIFLIEDGKTEPAYLVKRIDYTPDGKKIPMEDFASLMGKTPERQNQEFKYEGCYLDLFKILKAFTPAYAVQSLILFKLIIFNYLTANGDAHLKNFSVITLPNGEVTLSSAYDLMCTRLHIDDTDIALKDGLYAEIENQTETESFKANGFYAYDDFYELGIRAELPKKIVERTLQTFTSEKVVEKAKDLIARSYLSPELQERYRFILEDRFKRLQIFQF